MTPATTKTDFSASLAFAARGRLIALHALGGYLRELNEPSFFPLNDFHLPAGGN